MNNLSYSYDDLIDKSSTILEFSSDFSKEIDYLSTAVNKIRTNFQTQDAEIIYKYLDMIKEQQEIIRKSLSDFALAIRDEIAPTYKSIEEEAADSAASIYGD